MTPNQIITKAKKKVRTNTANLDWSGFYEDAIDEIFGKKPWRFARREINYIHTQSSFDKEFNADATELALTKLVSAYYTLSFTILMGVPMPASNSSKNLEYIPYTELNELYPDHHQDGYPDYITIITDNDGVSGMHIGIFRRPVSDAAVWIYGDFVPSYTIDDNPMPILPKQFHRLVVYKIIALAAEENGQDKLEAVNSLKFERGLADLDNWDRMNPIYRPRFQPYYNRYQDRRRPQFPDNYPR